MDNANFPRQQALDTDYHLYRVVSSRTPDHRHARLDFRLENGQDRATFL